MKKHFWTLCMILCALSIASCSKDEEDDGINALDSVPLSHYFIWYVTNEHLMTYHYMESKNLYGGTEDSIHYVKLDVTHNGGEFSIPYVGPWYWLDSQASVRFFVIEDDSSKAPDLELSNDSSRYKREPYNGEFFTTTLSPDGHAIDIALEKNNTLAERSFWLYTYVPQVLTDGEKVSIIHVSQNSGSLEDCDK